MMVSVAFVGGCSLELTRREFELIELLAGGEGRVLEREEIYSRLWGYAMVRGDRSVDVFVRKLRQKLEKASPGWRYIHTHFGIGYRFAAESTDETTSDLGMSADSPRSIATVTDPVVDTDASPSGIAQRGPLNGANAGGSDLGDGGVGDQGKLGGTQQEYELSATSA